MRILCTMHMSIQMKSIIYAFIYNIQKIMKYLLCSKNFMYPLIFTDYLVNLLDVIILARVSDSVFY